MGTPQAKQNNHLLAVDVLRGIAILMVITLHTFTPLYGHPLPWAGWFRDFSAGPLDAVVYPITYGWGGVSLFFVLSGFCIHLSFLRSPKFTLKRFFWQRFWRIAPAYFVALVAFTFLHRIGLNTTGGLKQFVTHAVFLHNFETETFFGINPSFWSIAAEAQLYLLFPVLLFIRQRYGIKGCLFATFIAGALWRFIVVITWGLPDHFIVPTLCFPLMAWFDWTLGVYVAEQFSQSRAGFTRRPLWLAVLIPAFVLSTLYKPLTIFSFTLAAAIAAVVLDWLIWANLQRKLVWGLFGFVGTISYSIYLWHQPLLFRYAAHLGQYVSQPVIPIVTAIAMVVLCVISYQIFERGGAFLASRLLLWFQKRRKAGQIGSTVTGSP